MNTNVREATVSEVLEAGDHGCTLIDVRTPAEFDEAHVAFARNIPLDRLSAAQVRRYGRSGQPMYLMCRTGTRARAAARRLTDAGVDRVVVVADGVDVFAGAGAPIVCGRPAMSIDRQVRIALGVANLLGIVLAATVHPAFIALSAFVGGGLIFAGVTDRCGMALLLAKMAWNNRRAGSDAVDSRLHPRGRIGLSQGG